MLPRVPFLPGESLLSWAARSAQAQTGMPLPYIASFTGLDRASFLAPDPDNLIRIAALFGGDARNLGEIAVHSHGPEMLRHRGEVFGADFISWRSRAFCPICIMEDAQPYGRLFWQLETTRACSRHDVALVKAALAGPDDIFAVPTDLYSSGRELAATSGPVNEQPASTLQTYIENRFLGASGPAWADAQRVDQVARAARALGISRLHGPKVRAASLTVTQVIEAESLGFEMVAKGETGIISGLEDILLASRRVPYQSKTPRSALGEVCCLAAGAGDVGPICSLLRSFILENFAIAAGTDVLGEEVPNRSRHNTASLASQFGLSLSTLDGALVHHRLLPPENDPPRATLVFDSSAGELVAQQVKSSISLANMSEYLGCAPVVARAITAEGLVEKAFPDHLAPTGRGAMVLQQWTKSSLDDFLTNLLAQGTTVDRAGGRLLPLVEAAKQVRWPVGYVIRLVRAGKLRVWTIRDRTDFGVLLLDPADLRGILHAPPGSSYMTPRMAGQRLGVDKVVVEQLLRTANDDGSPLMRRVMPTEGKDRNRVNVLLDDLELFDQTYISANWAFAEGNGNLEKTAQLLERRGIRPIPCRAVIGSRFYRRADL